MSTKCKTKHTRRHGESTHKRVQGTHAQRARSNTTHTLTGTGHRPRPTGFQTRKQVQCTRTQVTAAPAPRSCVSLLARCDPLSALGRRASHCQHTRPMSSFSNCFFIFGFFFLFHTASAPSKQTDRELQLVRSDSNYRALIGNNIYGITDLRVTMVSQG